MKKPFYVGKKGNVSVPVRAYRYKKLAQTYTYYLLDDYSSGQRLQRSFAKPEEAKQKADEIAAALAVGEKDLLGFAGQKREIVNALETVQTTGLRIDDAVRLVAEALKIVPANQLLDACKFWSDNRPGGLKPKTVSTFAREFMERQKGKISERRQKTNRSYLATLEKKFGPVNLHEITSVTLSDFADATGWSKRTCNDALNLYSQVWKEAVSRGHAVKNPASSEAINRAEVKEAEIGIFTPLETRQMLYRIEDSLKPALAIWSFSGLRMAEIARISVAEVRQGLKSGSIYLEASKAKTGTSRSVPICDNLRAWLERYLPVSGPVLPLQWQSLTALSELSRYVERKTGIAWKKNGPRHSFATCHLALHKDPPILVKQMGTSLAKLEKHYWARAASVTAVDAAEYFGIVPADHEKVLTMPATAAG